MRLVFIAVSSGIKILRREQIHYISVFPICKEKEEHPPKKTAGRKRRTEKKAL
jgi:hypothetical protein